MREDRSILRQSMYPGMLDVMEYNTKRKQHNIFLYEIGNVFSKKEEFEEISIIVKGKFNNNLLSKNNSDVDFFFIKAVLKRIGFILNVDLSIQESNGEEVYHPYQQAKIYFENEVVGHMGTFNPRLILKYDLKKVFGLTIKLSKILEKKKNMTFKNISKFPSISRDLSIIYPIDKSVKNLTDMISNTVKENLVDVKVFDVYKGESIHQGFKSISLRMTFNDSKKTLETSDVEKWMKKISHRLIHELGATLRG
jgi:phenylalanyl-tRNA synthetase beta chain